MHRYIDPNTLQNIKSLSAFDYIKNYHPDLLIKNGRTDYYHRYHDSLHFSNGKWYWWSKRTGGKSAIDYLIKVEGMEFLDACWYLVDLMKVSEPIITIEQPKERKPFVLPERDTNNHAIIHYLCDVRKIDRDIVNYFIDNNMLYQSKHYKNVVFVGYDGQKPAYAFKRSIYKNFKLDHAGSNKAFSFSFTNFNSDELHVFEAAIDLLSYMTILKMNNENYVTKNYLSLAGANNQANGDIPISLKSFLSRNPNIKIIVFHLDNDEVGISATRYMMNRLKDKYQCIDKHPTRYKDINEELINTKGVNHEQTIRSISKNEDQRSL